MNSKTLKFFTVLFMFIGVAFAVPNLPGHEYDNHCWQKWSEHIFKLGLQNTYYTSTTDYLPLYHYVLYCYGKIMGSVEAIYSNIGFLRLFTFIVELIGLYFVYLWTDKKTDFFLIAVFNTLNIAYSYNTVIWGQVDGILSTLIFLSMYFAYKQKMALSGLYFILAINLKLQAIIFLPVWGALYLINGINKRDWKAFVYAPLTIFFIQALLVTPFAFAEQGGIASAWQVVTGSVNKFPKVSMFAFNLWHLVCKTDPLDINDKEIFMAGISYQTTGLLLFCGSSFFALLPLLTKFFSALRKRNSGDFFPKKEVLWLICALIPLLFYFFCTQMHERYCHPAYIFIIAYSFYSKDFIPYALFSVAYFLNLEQTAELLHFDNYNTFILHPKFIAVLYALTIIYLSVKLFTLIRKPNTEQIVKDEKKLPYLDTANIQTSHAGN